jgi:DNA-binding transcriptional regulator YiaG
MTEFAAPMSNEELKLARTMLGLTQTEMAEALGLMGPNRKDTVRAWEYGRNPISGPARVAIRHMLVLKDLERSRPSLVAQAKARLDAPSLQATG